MGEMICVCRDPVRKLHDKGRQYRIYYAGDRRTVYQTFGRVVEGGTRRFAYGERSGGVVYYGKRAEQRGGITRKGVQRGAGNGFPLIVL